MRSATSIPGIEEDPHGKLRGRRAARPNLLKSTWPHFSAAARAEGVYKGGRSWPFCLPRDCVEENPFRGIRAAALAYFAAHEIKWHDGQDRRPSNHLCSSQVSCVNFLFLFAEQPRALAALLRPLFPDLAEMLPIEDGQFVAFEWIGRENYLGEKITRNGKRTRGANFTSADAAVMFRRSDGRRQIVLIEWKYTDSSCASSSWPTRWSVPRSSAPMRSACRTSPPPTTAISSA